MKLSKAKTQEEIDQRIEDWHSGKIQNIQIYEALGWTFEEYKTWVETSKIPN